MQNKYELKITELKAKYNKDEINYEKYLLTMSSFSKPK